MTHPYLIFRPIFSPKPSAQVDARISLPPSSAMFQFHKKGKDLPITCHEGTVREEMYGSTLSLTVALDGTDG